MKFLERFNFTSDEIERLSDNITPKINENLIENDTLVESNLEYLAELGVKNIKDIFTYYYDLFLMDNSNFEDIFNKYDRDDLLEKLLKNVSIIEYL